MRRSTRSLAGSAGALLATALVATACSGSTPSASPTTASPSGTGVRPVPGRGLFAPFTGCDDLLADLRARATTLVGPYGLSGPGGPIAVAEAGSTGVRSAAATTAAATTTAAAGAVPSAGPATDASAPAASASAGGGSSTTNTQEAGVDEGDEVETDGRHVYSVVDGRLRVVDTVTARQVAEVALPPGGHQLLLEGSRLVVVTSGWGGRGGPVPMPRPVDVAVAPGGGGTGTTVTVLDVADPSAPATRSQVALEGDLVAARSAAGVVRLVLRTPLGDRLPFVVPNKPGDDAARTATEANKKVIATSTIEDWLPRSYDVGPGGALTPLRSALSCRDVGRPTEDAGLGLTWLASLPVDGTTGVTGSAGVVSGGDVAYLGGSTLYVTTSVSPVVDPDSPTRPARPEPPHTAVHAFALGAGPTATYLASGQVPGRLLDSYSLSELGGVLRVATTEDGEGFGSSTSSGVYILRRDGADLRQVGAVTGLGRSERIYAVRFVGTLGYVVTFRQTDPLYVLDLRDPTAPRAVGELKIPGYSAYLHPVGDGLLLGVGQAATDDGRRTGSAVSLFDVSDPAAPRRLDTLTLAERWSQSEVEYDPHAFLWWAPAGRAVLPVNGPDATGAYRSAAQVVAVDGTTLRLVGAVEHPRAASDANPSVLRRSLVVDGRLVTVSDNGLKVSDLTTLADTAWLRWPA